jgi:hypothetical protein
LAEIIGDGYDWIGDVDGRKFVYRPMLSRERRVSIEIMKSLGDTPGFDYASSVILKHLCLGFDKSHVNKMLLCSPETWESLWLTICGLQGEGSFFDGWESSTSDNLRSGVRLFVKNPKLAKRSCDECRKYWYDENGERVTYNGKYIERVDESPVACDTTFGCLAGHYLNQLRLTPVNKMAYLHFQDCQATGNFPDDPIVARNARIIKSAERLK